MRTKNQKTTELKNGIRIKGLGLSNFLNFLENFSMSGPLLLEFFQWQWIEISLIVTEMMFYKPIHLQQKNPWDFVKSPGDQIEQV